MKYLLPLREELRGPPPLAFMRVMIRFRMRAYLHARLPCGDPFSSAHLLSHIIHLCVTAVFLFLPPQLQTHLRRLVFNVHAQGERSKLKVAIWDGRGKR